MTTATSESTFSSTELQRIVLEISEESRHENDGLKDIFRTVLQGLESTPLEVSTLGQLQTKITTLVEESKLIREQSSDAISGGHELERLRSVLQEVQEILLLSSQSASSHAEVSTEVALSEGHDPNLGRFVRMSQHEEQPEEQLHMAAIECCTFLDSIRVITGSLDTRLKLWNLIDGTVQDLDPHHDSCVTGLSAENSASRFVTCSMDGTLKIWKETNGVSSDALVECQQTVVAKDGTALSGCAFLDDKRILAARWDSKVQTYSLETGECEQTFHGHGAEITSCIPWEQGKKVVSCSSDKCLKVWNAETGTCLHTLKGHSGNFTCCAALDDDRVVTGSLDKTLLVWNLAKAPQVKFPIEQVLVGHAGSVSCCAVFDQGRRVVSGGWDQTLKIWNVATGQCEQTLETDSRLHCCAFRDGRIVGGGSDRRLYAWEWQAN